MYILVFKQLEKSKQMIKIKCFQPLPILKIPYPLPGASHSRATNIYQLSAWGPAKHNKHNSVQSAFKAAFDGTTVVASDATQFEVRLITFRNY